MKKHPYVAVMEAVRESLSGEAMRLFKMKVESLKKQGEKQPNKPIDSPTLKPCPFCGGDVKMYKEELDHGRFIWFVIGHCKDEDQETCIRLSYRTKEEAIRHWNKRDA